MAVREEAVVDGTTDGTSDPDRRLAAATPIAALHERHRALVTGRIVATRILSLPAGRMLEVEITDDTAILTVLFYGRDHMPGIQLGRRIRVSGVVGTRNGHPAIRNPYYELLPVG